MRHKKGDYPIPFDKDGNQQDYPTKQYYSNGNRLLSAEPKWVDNHEFSDTLTLVDYGRGRSSVTFTMRRTNGKTVSVFVSDFCEMAKNAAFSAGQITGLFTFTKKGANYGCKLMESTP
jgi:hypothetical protein